MINEFTHIDLYTGLGGFALAAQHAGFRTEVFCENDLDCIRFLRKAWPEIPIVKSIEEFDGKRWTGKTVFSAGVPCQLSSNAGEQRGEADDRWLWPETLRVVSEGRPDWAVFENPLGLRSVGLDGIITELENIDYETVILDIPACAIDSPQLRHRFWIVAYSKTAGLEGNDAAGPAQTGGRPAQHAESSILADWRKFEWIRCTDGKQRRSKPGICGLAHGVSRQLLEALGNSIVPQVAYEIFRAIGESWHPNS